MTYCVAVMLDSGLVFASDSRTNAGVDQVGNFCKMTVHEQPGERVIVLLSSGNLAVTQAVVSLLDQHALEHRENMWNTSSLYQTACLVGEIMRQVYKRDGPYLAQRNIDPSANFILGGQIKGERQRLFNIYTEGNFIEATLDTPYFQNGETRYGKPIIDRVITNSTSLMDASKCLLISFDVTMRSNISVGLPIDILCYEQDTFKVATRRRIVEGDTYFEMLHRQWGDGVKQLFSQLPEPHWED